MGDIHGAWKALRQCLDRSPFNDQNDILVQLGDVADGHDEVCECVDTLLGIKNLVAIRGNHDDWFREYLFSGVHPDGWRQGGAGTAKSYLRRIGKEEMIVPVFGGYMPALNPADVPDSHHDFFRRQLPYYIDEQGSCFVHGGFDRQLPFKGQHAEVYMWDRSLWDQALSYQAGRHKRPFHCETSFREIFLGHTSTIFWRTDQPMHAAHIWNIDTGGGGGGRLTIMDTESKEYWQSDPVGDLYPRH